MTVRAISDGVGRGFETVGSALGAGLMLQRLVWHSRVNPQPIVHTYCGGLARDSYLAGLLS